MITIRSAGLVLFRLYQKTAEYLVIKHPQGHWDVPKGKIEPEETAREAAIRELFEETGLYAKFIPGFQAQTTYQYSDQDGVQCDKQVKFFLGKAEEGSVRLSHEHVDFAWLSFDEAVKRITYNNSRLVIKEAHKVVMQCM